MSTRCQQGRECFERDSACRRCGYLEHEGPGERWLEERASRGWGKKARPPGSRLNLVDQLAHHSISGYSDVASIPQILEESLAAV